MAQSSIKYQVGELMKSISTMLWVTMFLGWLIIPAIILLIKMFTLRSRLNEFAASENDPMLKEAADKFGLAMIMMIIPLGFTQLIGWIMMIIAFGKLSEYGINSHNDLLAQGAGSIKTGYILQILFIGIFIIPGGYSKAGTALMAA